MRREQLVGRILDDERLTDGLDSDAASLLIAWLVRGAETIADQSADDAEALRRVELLCRRGHEIARQSVGDTTVLTRLLDREPFPA